MGRAKRGHGSRGSRVTALVALLGLTVQAFTLAGLGGWVVKRAKRLERPSSMAPYGAVVA